MALDLFGPANAPGTVGSRPAETRTFGSSDTFFKDCSTPTADDGTEFQAAWFNQVLDALRGFARGNGLTGASAEIVSQDNADNGILLKSVQHLIQRGQPSYAVDSGSANAMVVSTTPAAAEYKAGMTLRVKVNANNTGATTLNWNALGTKAVTHVDGSALVKDDMIAGQIAELSYDGTQFQLISIGSPTARNKMFVTNKPSDQSLSFGTLTDVSFPVTTCAFGTFNGVTFTWSLPGTYMTFSGLYVDATISDADYIHVGGNFVKNGGTSSGYGYGDAQIFGPTANTLALTNWGMRVDEIVAGDTMKVQASSAATTYWTAGKVRASGQSFFAIVRF